MGVPKFFRWLSERYPKINQRYGCPPDPETAAQHFPERNGTIPQPLEAPDPMATCGLGSPPIDRLYLDMNGIIHGCSHNNNEDDFGGTGTADDAWVESGGAASDISREEIFRNVCYYLDRIVGDMVQPKELVYMAIDGVAPRAKLNQQRSRRYRSGGEGEIEHTIYEAHEQEKLRQFEEEQELFQFHQEEKEKQQYKYDGSSSYSFILDADEGNAIYPSEDDDFVDNNLELDRESSSSSTSSSSLKEVSRGRFKGKFEAHETSSTASESSSSSLESSTSPQAPQKFHSNEITPGTPFFTEFTQHLEHFVKHKLSTDPKWKNLTIVFSGPNVPGEGEHKIMQFMREQKATPGYDPNLGHCIMGQDGDLMMLGLLTHEPNMVLLREKVVFNVTKDKLEKAKMAEQKRNESTNDNGNSAPLNSSLDQYIYNPHFEFLHLQVLRDYLAYEFETSNVLGTSPWDLERTIDDFVFLTFLIGNDFLPHLPALDIADQAFDLLYYTYKKGRLQWLEDDPENPYLTHAGNIVSGHRLEHFLSSVGGHETKYYEKKKQFHETEQRRLRKHYKRLGMSESAFPDDGVVASKEEADRASYRAMLQQQALKQQQENQDVNDNSSRKSKSSSSKKQHQSSLRSFVPVTSQKVDFQPAEDAMEEGLIRRMGTLLQNSLSSSNSNVDDDYGDSETYEFIDVDDQDLKGRYYYDKFDFSPFDGEKHRALRKSYIEGLVWNLKYYYEGCVSWDWYYPYHYGPMLSDLVGLDELLEEIEFDNLGAPLRPFDQLMGCMPPSQSHHLPEPYRPLMNDPSSPIIDFYPKTFVVDMNGKRWPWEAVTLLPFIDSKRLLDATRKIDSSKLSEEERQRNSEGNAVVMRHDPKHSESVEALGQSAFFGEFSNSAISIPFEETELYYTRTETPVFLPQVKEGTEFPQPGFATLRDAPIETLYRKKLKINVHGGKSRYKTASLELSSTMPPLPAIEMLAPKLIGTTVFINYPYFVEALVTAVSDENKTVRGKAEPRKWTPEESAQWENQRDNMIRLAEIGEGIVGSGGLILPEDQTITLSVRPFQGFTTTSKGQKVKTFGVFEVEIPLISTFWAPSNPDPRLMGVPSRLEKNAYEIAQSKNTKPKIGQEPSLFKRKYKRSLGRENNFRRSNNNGTSKMASAANYSSLHSRNNHRDKGNRRGYASFTQALWSHPTPYPALDGRYNPCVSSLSQQWELSRNLASAASKSSSRYPTVPTMYSSQARHTMSVFAQASSRGPSKKKVSYSNYGARRMGTRGRIVATGLAMAACLWNPASAISDRTQLSFWKERQSSTLQHHSKPIDLGISLEQLLCKIPRGGDIESSSSDNAFLPPQKPTPPLEFAHGTTTLSFAFQGGIIAAVDSRASLGQFVGSKTTQKVLPVSSHILGTMAGGAADCQHWIRRLKTEALLHEMTEDGRRMSVARASRILSNYMYGLRGYDLSVGTMIMGYDDAGEDAAASESQPHIYYVDNTGLRLQGDMFAVGSGSTFALGILDSQTDRYNLSAEDAIALGIKAIRHATFRDAYSGGYINVYLITPQDGWKKVYTEDIARTPEAWKARNEEKAVSTSSD